MAQTVGQVSRVKKFAAVFAFAEVVVKAIVANLNFVTVPPVNCMHRVIVTALGAPVAPRIRILPATFADHDFLTVPIVSVRHIVPVVQFTAFGTFTAIFLDAIRADVGIVNTAHIAARIIFVAVATEKIAVFQTVLADICVFAICVDDVSGGITATPAFVTRLPLFGVAPFAIKFFVNLVAATDAQTIGADLERLVIVKVILMDRDSCVELRIKPIFVSAETGTGVNLYSAFVSAIFFSPPEIGNPLKLGNFALNKVTIQIGISVMTASAAVRVVKSTLKQETVIRLIHEQLPCRFAIVECFGIIWVRRSEDNKSHVVAGITAAAAVVSKFD